jgi:hypothetical protein
MIRTKGCSVEDTFIIESIGSRRLEPTVWLTRRTRGRPGD